jgi:predicted nucleic acid-binding Zn ribbon protein
MMDNKIKILLAKAKERRKMYSRRAALCDELALALYIPAMVFMLFGVAAYFFGYDHRPPFAISTVLWIAGYAAYILHVIYDGKAVEAARQVCILECMLEREPKRGDTSQQSIRDVL